MPARKMKRVSIHLPSPRAKVTTSVGIFATGSLVSLPEGEAQRLIDLGKARYTEAAEDAPVEPENVVEERKLAGK